MKIGSSDLMHTSDTMFLAYEEEDRQGLLTSEDESYKCSSIPQASSHLPSAIQASGVYEPLQILIEMHVYVTTEFGGPLRRVPVGEPLNPRI